VLFALGYAQDSMGSGSRVFWGLWVAYWLFMGFRFTRAGIVTSEHGIHVVNLFTSFDLRWGEITEFRVGRWKLLPYACRIELRDGSAKVALGIQERTNFPSGSAETMAAELNEELGRRSPLAAAPSVPIP